MASLGKGSALAFPFGRDGLPPSPPNGYYRTIANAPSGVRFANAGVGGRKLAGYSDGIFSHVSSVVVTGGSMKPNDQTNLSGVIRQRGKTRNNNLPAKVRG